MKRPPLSLTISSFGAIVVDNLPVTSVRAEDASGSFGVLPGHDEFLTVLELSVLSWRDLQDQPGYCAVRGGVFSVHEGTRVAVAASEAIIDTDLERLETKVLHDLHLRDDADRRARSETTRMELRAVRELLRYL